MKYTFRVTVLLIIFALMACSEASKETAKEDAAPEYMKVTSQVTETYGDEGAEKEIVEYSYEKESDDFWVKAEYKDAEGNVMKTVKRELDENRMPVKEMTEELGMVTETIVTKYDPETHLLVEKTIYDGEPAEENKTQMLRNNYEDGCIISQETFRYSSDEDFKNEEGTAVESYVKLNALPAKENRPKGDFMPAFFVSEMKQYCTAEEKDEGCKDKTEACSKGHIENHIMTKVSDEGYPLFMTTNEPECEHHAASEYYKVEKDGLGNVVAIVGYKDSAFTESTPGNMKKVFVYNDKGMIHKYAEYFYNDETGKYDRMHRSANINWVKSDVDNPACEYAPSVYEESYCYGRKVYSVTQEKINKFSGGEKIVEVSSFSEKSETGPVPEKIKLEPSKKVLTYYETVKK